MKIDILCEGRLNKGLENELCEMYIKRTIMIRKSGISKIEIKKISDHRNYKIKKNELTKNFILDEQGVNINSIEFFKKITVYNNEGIKLINFFIGKPEGYMQNIHKFEKLSLGNMTFSHSLARVILCEQIYRCATMKVNHPYHKA